MANTTRQWEKELNDLFKDKEEIEYVVGKDTFVLRKNDLKSMVNGVHGIYNALAANDVKTAKRTIGELHRLFSRKSSALQYAEYVYDTNFIFE